MRTGRNLLVLVLAALLAGWAPATPGTASTPVATPVWHAAPAWNGPAEPYAVGVRALSLRRGARRLPTLVWYPVTGVPGARAATGTAVAGAPVAAGRFPLVLFSHGLRGLPESYAAIITRWVAAGFVVAAPAYPHTNARAVRFDRGDVRNQPADAWYVITRVLALDTLAGDPLAGHLDATRIAAVGHSAGGYTTAGMLTAGHDARLRGAVVIAGAAPLGRFAGPPAAVLFVHGDADPVVPAARGRAAYASVPWPKAFLTVGGGDHGGYLTPAAAGQPQVYAATTDFLRWTLHGDTAAKRRLASGHGRTPDCCPMVGGL